MSPSGSGLNRTDGAEAAVARAHGRSCRVAKRTPPRLFPECLHFGVPDHALLQVTDRGLYCEAGDFFIDPWRPVERAVITHAHSDHARRGHSQMLCAPDGVEVLRSRMLPGAAIDPLPYGEPVDHRGVQISLAPAGHILGSAQVRVEFRGEVWVVSGDYKLSPDPTCRPFEPVRCHTFITECTFGLPIYHWAPQAQIADELNAWWRRNREAGRHTVVFAYALGKSQRLLAAVDPTIGPIVCHGAVERVNDEYRSGGISLPPTQRVTDFGPGELARGGALVIAPPSAVGTPWLRRFQPCETAFASGWMLVRGSRRRRGVDRGLVLSDHADWPGLLAAIKATGCQRVLATHGHTSVLVRYLRERGWEADSLHTEFVGERDDLEVDTPELPVGTAVAEEPA